jgi:nucleoside-diphosphate-sugar epimerase
MINKIFLTGASGFIGKNLHKILKKKKKLKLFQLDIEI